MHESRICPIHPVRTNRVDHCPFMRQDQRPSTGKPARHSTARNSLGARLVDARGVSNVYGVWGAFGGQTRS